MKNLFIIIFLVAGTSAFAQFSVGFKAGMSLSDYSVKTKYTKANKGGLAAGVVLMNTLGKNIAVQADVMYIQKGYNHQICNQCYDKFVSTFLEIPVTLKYSFYVPKLIPKLENLKVHATGGFYFAHWLNAKYETKIFDDKITQKYAFSGEKRGDFGPNFGAGIEYALFSGSLIFDYRYSLGLVDMSAPGSTNAQKNRSAILSITYLKSF